MSIAVSISCERGVNFLKSMCEKVVLQAHSKGSDPWLALIMKLFNI